MEVVIPEAFRQYYSVPSRVLRVPEPLLRMKARDVIKFGKHLANQADDMIKIMKAHRGLGLAGPQLGIMKRIVVVQSLLMPPTIFVNPVILKSDGAIVTEEGCLSIPGLFANVTRPSEVVVEAKTLQGKTFTKELDGMASVVIQHEIDHLDGILFTDRADMETLKWRKPF